MNNKEMATVFLIQDGGGRHLEFSVICISDSLVTFHIGFATCPPNLVRIGQIALKWQLFFEIQDGGGRHLENYTSG